MRWFSLESARYLCISLSINKCLYFKPGEACFSISFHWIRIPGSVWLQFSLHIYLLNKWWLRREHDEYIHFRPVHSFNKKCIQLLYWYDFPVSYMPRCMPFAKRFEHSLQAIDTENSVMHFCPRDQLSISGWSIWKSVSSERLNGRHFIIGSIAERSMKWSKFS